MSVLAVVHFNWFLPCDCKRKIGNKNELVIPAKF
jgi:hypothetical protein